MSEFRIIHGAGLPKNIRDFVNRELQLVDPQAGMKRTEYDEPHVPALDPDEDRFDNECSELRLGYDRFEENRRRRRSSR